MSDRSSAERDSPFRLASDAQAQGRMGDFLYRNPIPMRNPHRPDRVQTVNKEYVMALWTFWPGDTLPALSPLAGFSAGTSTDIDELMQLTGLDAREIESRLEAGHCCYVARLGDAAVAYGWVARADASIGELTLAFQLRESDRYLWDFVTLPAWRGKGIYPHLLQSILRQEGLAESRFWIINAPENVASAKGIGKAGFRVVGDLSFTREGRAGILPTGDPGQAGIGAALLGVPLVERGADAGVSPCWCCVMDALSRGTRAPSCWPAGALADVVCTCGGVTASPARNELVRTGRS